MSPTDERIPRHSIAESLNNCRKYIRQIELDCENLCNLHSSFWLNVMELSYFKKAGLLFQYEYCYEYFLDSSLNYIYFLIVYSSLFEPNWSEFLYLITQIYN